MARTNDTIVFIVDNVKDGEGNLQMRVRWDSYKVGVNLGYKVEVSKWDKDLQRCVANTTHSRKKITASEINRTINRYRQCALSVFDELPRHGLDVDTYRSSLRSLLGREDSVSSDSLYTALNGVLARNEMGVRDSTLVTYRNAVVSLRKEYPSLRICDMDEELISEYESRLVSRGLNNRTIALYCRLLVVLLKHIGVDVRYKGKVKYNPKAVVWLDWNELMSVYNADIPSLDCGSSDVWVYEYARDIFCLSCFTGLRYSDVVGLSKSDDLGTMISRTLIKTNELVNINTNKYARSILDRYRYRDGDKAMPRLTLNTLNDCIRDICKALKIDEPVNIVKYVGAKRVEEVVPKYKALSSHTGRRTFICNALALGISPQVVMKWTGHKNYNSMRPYIDVADETKSSAMALFDEHK